MIDAVVVTADSREMVLECLDHLRSPSLAAVIVVDNGSTDGTAEAVAKQNPEVRVLRLEQSRGLAEPYNLGARAGSADLVLFLNDDILADDGSIERLEATLRSTPGAVAAAGRLVDPGSGETQVEYQPRSFPTPMRFFAAFAGLERIWPTNPWSGSHRKPLADDEVVPVDQPPGACLLVRREVFDQVGGWDEQFEFWFEDVDLARRLRQHGDVLYVPTASFRHVGGQSARRLSKAEIVRRYYQGALVYADKHFNRPQQVATGAMFAFASGTRGLLARRSDRELAAVHRRIAKEALALIAGRRIARP